MDKTSRHVAGQGGLRSSLMRPDSFRGERHVDLRRQAAFN